MSGQPFKTPLPSSRTLRSSTTTAPQTTDTVSRRLPLRHGAIGAGEPPGTTSRIPRKPSGGNLRESMLGQGGRPAPATSSRVMGTLKRSSGTAGIQSDADPPAKRPPSALDMSLTTPSTSRHLLPAPSTLLRSHSHSQSLSTPAHADPSFLANDKIRALTADLSAAHSKAKQVEGEVKDRDSRILALERELGERGRRETVLEAQVESGSLRIAELEKDRRVVEARLADDARERAEEVNRAIERAQASRGETREAKAELEAVHSAHESLMEDHRRALHTLEQMKKAAEGEVRRLEMLEDEVGRLEAVVGEQRAKEEEEREKRENVEKELEKVKREVGEVGNRENATLLDSELRRQGEHLKTLESANGRLTRELATHKAHHQSVTLLTENVRSLESQLLALPQLRASLASTESQLSALQRERAEWTAYLDSSPSSSDSHTFTNPGEVGKALAAGRIENVTLRERLGTREAEIKARDRMVGELEERLEELEAEVEKEAGGRRVAEEKLGRVEKGKALERRQLEMLKEQLKSYTTEKAVLGVGSGELVGVGEEERALEVKHLEELLDLHKKELSDAVKEATRLRGLLETQGGRTMEIEGYRGEGDGDETMEMEGRSPGKKKVGESLRKQIAINEELEKECDELADENDLLKLTISTLENQIDSLNHSLGRGEYNPATTKVLELVGSPAQKDLAIRTTMLDGLKAENRALLEKLTALERRKGHVNDGGNSEAMVPRESWDNLQEEIRQLTASIAQKETFHDRLKSVFTAKAREYREAVHSLFGYRLDFDKTGVVKVTSTFAPSNDYTMAFTSGKGDVGSMQLVGAGNEKFMMSQAVREAMRFWVTERGCIPGFMASMTIELFDGTTRGQAGGFIG